MAAKDRKKVEEPEGPTRAELESTAKQMNEVMGLDPAIKFNRKTTDEELAELIKENAYDEDETQIYTSDFEEDPEDEEKVIFDETAEKVFEMLDIEIGEEAEPEPEPEVEEKPAKGKKGAKEEKEEKKPAAKPGKGKKEEPEEEPEPEKPAKGAKGKPAAKEEKAAPAKKDKEKKPAKKKESTRKRRYEVFADLINDKKKHTKQEAIDYMIEEYGGSEKEAVAQLGHYLDLLDAVGAIELKGDSFKLTI